MSRQPDVSVGGHSFRLFLLFLAAICAVTVASGARLTTTGVVLRRLPLQILKESETDFAPGTSGGGPTYWLYRDFHREVPAQVEATGWILAGNMADRAERVATHHVLWSEFAPDDDAPPALPNVARASLLENIARSLTSVSAAQY